jgi:D-sedoheptulose 7-phosphate isomerase
LPEDFFARHKEAFSRFSGLNAGKIERASRLIADSFESDGKLYICGADLSVYFARYTAALFNSHHAGNRPALPAVALDYLSARSDEDIFSRQLSALITDRDILLGLAAAPPFNSIQKAFHLASLSGAKTIAIVGADDGRFKNLCDAVIEADLKNYPAVQEMHLFTLHTVCDMVDKIMFRQV